MHFKSFFILLAPYPNPFFNEKDTSIQLNGKQTGYRHLDKTKQQLPFGLV
jgi:hypothetical protein